MSPLYEVGLGEVFALDSLYATTPSPIDYTRSLML